MTSFLHDLKAQNGRPSHNGTGRGGACRIHLVRHGRTAMNVEIRFRGHLEVPLDEQGRKEAWLAAERLASADIRGIYTSPLGRAREVANAVAHATGAPVTDLHGLLNLDYGKWEGLTKDECAERDPAAWRLYRESPEQAACPEGETLADAGDRIIEALRTIGERHAGEAVAAITHGVMVRLAIVRTAPRPPADWNVPLPTGSATVFEVEDGRVSIVDAAAATKPYLELATLR